ncbi:MAG: nucleotide-binding protein [Candidatus Poribacteria bacterium]|nr:nucleotide-binding protein [Candidatus Poribacteria bacterium]
MEAKILPKVFITYRYDDEAKAAVAGFVEELGLNPTVLHEQPIKGQTIIDKFEEHADEAGFAIVLLTPDDVGSSKATGKRKLRARQDVIFELGYLLGGLGGERVCALYKEGVELPSDIPDVVYVPMDSADDWKSKLRQGMQKAGLPIDMSDVLSKDSPEPVKLFDKAPAPLRSPNNAGTSIFIGHGSSQDWLELRNFMDDGLGLPCGEFNHVILAGATTIEHPTEILDQAGMVLFVMTSEDQQAYGTLQAREHVIPDANPFQSRFGSGRAIILLEEGCQAFSSIHSHDRIQFPKGKISEVFEEVREVLERKKIIG